MSEADKIFEELGYEKEISYNLIAYDKKVSEPYRGFNKQRKTFLRYYTITFDTSNKTFYKGSNCRDNAIIMAELKAINKKCEELGWV